MIKFLAISSVFTLGFLAASLSWEKIFSNLFNISSIKDPVIAFLLYLIFALLVSSFDCVLFHDNSLHFCDINTFLLNA